MTWQVYLSGEVHTDWRERIQQGAAGLGAEFTGPVSDHAASDECGVAVAREPEQVVDILRYVTGGSLR